MPKVAVPQNITAYAFSIHSSELWPRLCGLPKYRFHTQRTPAHPKHGNQFLRKHFAPRAGNTVYPQTRLEAGPFITRFHLLPRRLRSFAEFCLHHKPAYAGNSRREIFVTQPVPAGQASYIRQTLAAHGGGSIVYVWRTGSFQILSDTPVQIWNSKSPSPDRPNIT